MKQPAVKVIYSGGYIPDLGVITETKSYKGWLVYRHPDGQWVTLTDLKPFAYLMLTAPESMQEPTTPEPSHD